LARRGNREALHECGAELNCCGQTGVVQRDKLAQFPAILSPGIIAVMYDLFF
jgi:hypothetical protein